jgi:hypothetical protein
MGAQVAHNAFLNVKLGLWFQFSFHPRSLKKQTKGKNPTKKKKKILAEDSGWVLLNSSSLLPQKPMNTNNQPQGKKKSESLAYPT